jgi:16S rRNA (guanine527-N7)-methyltransferase
MDLGSGAGLPGLPLAIAGEPVTLVEPRQRAQAFLELALRELGLSVEIIPTTAEETGKGPLREASSVVVARALARPSIALELCSPLCRPGGQIILTASQSATAIEGEWLDQLGLGPPQLVDIPGPGDIHQLFHIVQKLGSVAEAFPRKQGQAQRKPLA